MGGASGPIPDVANIPQAPDDFARPCIEKIQGLLGAYRDPTAVLQRGLVYLARDLGSRGSYSILLAGSGEGLILDRMCALLYAYASSEDDMVSLILSAFSQAVGPRGYIDPPQTTPIRMRGGRSPAPAVSTAAEIAGAVATALSQSLAQLIPSISPIQQSNSTENSSMVAVARHLNPIVTSFGPNACPYLAATGACDTLEGAGAPLYSWPSAAPHAGRVRAILGHMARFLRDGDSGETPIKWLQSQKIRLAAQEYTLVRFGPGWAAAEFVGALAAGDRDGYALVVFARLAGVDSSQLEEYASGRLVLHDAPALGGRKGYGEPQRGGGGGGGSTKGGKPPKN